MYPKLFHLVFGLAVVNAAVLPSQLQVPSFQTPLRPRPGGFRTELVKRGVPTLSRDKQCGPPIGSGHGAGTKCNPDVKDSGYCCSAWGICGNDRTFCGKGCQPEFGWCSKSPKPYDAATMENTCGIVGGGAGAGRTCNAANPYGGQCCSAWGYCGNTAVFCTAGCQAEYGNCDPSFQDLPDKASGPSLPDTTSFGVGPVIQTPKPVVSRRGRKLPEHILIPPSSPKPKGPDHDLTRCGPDYDSQVCPNSQCCSAGGYCGVSRDHCLTPYCQINFGRCDSSITPGGNPTVDDPRLKVGSVPYGVAIYRCAKEKVVGLSYDDGPSPYTDALLDLLQKYKFRATFFISGNNNGKGGIDNSRAMSASILRMVNEGHQVGNHGWSHYNFDQVEPSFRRAEMYKNERAIANIIGRYPTYMRAPYSACSQASGCVADMEKLGYHQINQDLNTEDWLHPGADQIQYSKDIVKSTMDQLPADGNALSIQHDINPQSASNLSTFLFEQIVQKGWKGVTIGECLFDPEENWYRYPSTNTGMAAHKAVAKYVVPAGEVRDHMKVFSNLKGCKETLQDCLQRYKVCYAKDGSGASGACPHYQGECSTLQEFCMTCESEKRKKCDSRNVKFVPLAPPRSPGW